MSCCSANDQENKERWRDVASARLIADAYAVVVCRMVGVVSTAIQAESIPVLEQTKFQKTRFQVKKLVKLA